MISFFRDVTPARSSLGSLARLWLLAALIGCALTPDAALAQEATTPLARQTPSEIGYPGWGRAAGIASLCTAVLTAAGGVGLAVFRDQAGGLEHGLFLGVAAASVPIIAFGGRSSRHAADVPGQLAVRSIAWTNYSSLLAVGIAQILSVARGGRAIVFPVLSTVFGVVSQLAMGFDAYSGARQARVRRLSEWLRGC